jgi:RNA polymerase sigma-70 factor, ECF subfamily
VAIVEDLGQLVRAARGGDRVALERFVGLAYDEVWRLCSALVDEPSADDLAQDTFIRAIKALHRFRGDASPRTWLLSIARNACMDELRARTRRRRQQQELADIQSREPRSASDASERMALLELIAQLAPERREAFVLTQLLRLSYDEAAAVCDCPAGTIHSRVARARSELIGLYAGSHTDSRQTSESDSSS